MAKTKLEARQFSTVKLLGVAAGGLLLGIWLTVATQNAKPGDFLYALKRGIEAFQLAMATSPEDKTATAIRQANERVSEIQRIITVPSGTNGGTGSQVGLTVHPSTGTTTTTTQPGNSTTLINVPLDTLDSLLGSYQSNLDEVVKQLPLVQGTAGESTFQSLTEQVTGTTLGNQATLENLVEQVNPPAQQLLNDTLNSISGLNLGGLGQ
jgi:hypothetical protein